MNDRSGRWISSLVLLALGAGPVWAVEKPVAGWLREDVDWRATGGQRIKGLFYPPNSPPQTRARQKVMASPKAHRALLPPTAASRWAGHTSQVGGQQTGGLSAVSVLIVDAPPLDGFVPYVTVSTTSEKTSQDEISRQSTTVGNMLPGRQADFAIGLFDTGAGADVMGYADSLRLGVIEPYLTDYEIEITGVTGSVFAWISEPIGTYVDGLRAIDAVSGVFNNADMVGQWNVEIAVGKQPEAGQPDLPTVLGSLLAVYYAAHFRNDQPLTRIVSGESYTAPDISFHDRLDPALPEYPIYVPMQLRPVNAVQVQYIPCFEIFGECIINPAPSIIVGDSAQSLFFLSSVDLYDRQFSALERTDFILDTGAQVTVISRQTATLLSINTNQPEFQVEIEGVDGQVTLAPGFYLDRVDLPADGEWLRFTNVPIVVLDVASPEGGFLQGIIGMNLLTDYNFIVRGGGLSGQGAEPSLECEVIAPLTVDVDYDGDNDVDLDDYAHFQACFTGPDKAQKSAACVNAKLDADSDVDDGDFTIFAACRSGPEVPASPECITP